MSNITFGTDGIRTSPGKHPFTLASLPLLGHAIGLWASHRYEKNTHVLIARDTRLSGEWIASSLCSGLLVHPLTIYSAGILPTPTVCHLLHTSDLFSIGIVISASHNPHHDNGIKIIDRTTGKIAKHDEQFIASAFQKKVSISYASYGSFSLYPTAAHDYIDTIVKLFPRSFLTHNTIVLDCAHGAPYLLAPAIFAALGAHVIPINNTPNGTNINQNCGSLHIQDLQKAVIAHNATIGFAFDGDGDRVIAVNKKGEVRDGDDMLALLSHHPLYAHQKVIVGTIMSNLGLDAYLQQHGKKCVRTKVGDKYVAQYLNKHQLLLGGEPSGHIILNDYLPTGDGIVTALRICETMIMNSNWYLETFPHFPQIIMNLPITVKKDLTDPIIASIIKDHEAQLTSGRLIVRYSGTENVLRIMIEDQNTSTVTKLSTTLAHVLQKYLQ